MASPNLQTNGAGGSSGSEFATVAPIYTSGDVWYVYSVTGSDAASPRGKERIRPLATLAQAHTNAAAGDVICILSGHTETLTAAQTFNKAGLLVIGEGSGATRPRFTRFGNVVMFDVTAAGVMFDNLFFPASVTTSSASARMRFAGGGNQCRNCYFECSTLDDGPSIETVTGAADILIRDTTVISTATSISDQPDSAIKVTNALSRLDLDTVTMDGGSSGWANPFTFNGAAAITTLRGINMDLLRDSDMTFATGTTGYLHVRNHSGSARVVWTA